MSLPALAFTSLSLVAQIAPPKPAGKAVAASGYDVRLSTSLRAQLLEQIGQTSSSLTGVTRTRQKEMGDGLAALRASLPGVEASISPLTGGLDTLRNPRGTLTPASGAANARTVVMDFVQSNAALYGLSADDVASLRVRGESVSGANGLRMLRVEQRVHDLPVFQSETRFLVDRQGRLVRSVGRLAPRATSSAAAPAPAIMASQALVSALHSVGITIDAAAVTTTPRGAAVSDYADLRVAGTTDVAGDVVSQLVYFPLAPGVLRLAYQQTTFTSGAADWLTLVDASTGVLLWRKNIRAYASTEQARFSVYVQGDGKTPADSPAPHSPTLATAGSGFQAPEIARTIVNMLTAQDAVASPDGWIPDGGSTTTGNNVDACLDRVGGAGEVNVCDAGALDSNGRPVGNPDVDTRNRDFLGNTVRDFNYAPAPQGGNPDAGDTPTGTTAAQDAFRRGAVTQLFYISNWYHDQVFHLGFDEASGNFQQTNYSGMGNGNDRVLAEAQDSSGTNNANFSTPPDGQSGRMQMYRFTGSAPDRDGDLDAEIVIHELTHGLSNRLVGNAAGLNFDVGAGLGEGWSDFYALSLLNGTNADDPNASYASGAYATYNLGGLTDNYVYGIRRFPYSTDNAINPLTWADVDDVMANYSGGIPISPLGFELGGAFEVHNVGELWALSLWEIRARIIANPAGANGDVPTGNRMMLQLVTDALKMTPIDPSVIEARDALIDADCATNACANERWIWEGFADRGLGYDALAPLGKVGFNNLNGHMGLGESFALPRLDIAARTIDDSLGNGSGGVDAGEPFRLTVSLKNPWRGAGLGVPTATATLTSSTPGVIIVDGTASFGAIAPQATVAASDTFTVAAPAAAACGGSIAFTLQVTSALGTSTQDFTLRLGVPVGVGAPITYTRTIPGGRSIPDNFPTGVADAMTITDDFEIADIDFRVDSLTHTFTGDVTMMLRGPNGYGTDLIWRRGARNGEGTGDNYTNTVIDDASVNDLIESLDTAAPFTGSWAPAFNSNMWNLLNVTPDAVGQLSRFNGTSTQGVWTTLTSDIAAADTGTLHGWSLIVTPRAYSCSAYVDPAPTTTILTTPLAPNGANGWFTSPVALSVLASDYIGGTVTETRCVLDPVSAPGTFGAIAPGCAFAAPGATVATDGLHALYAASIDNQANAETPVLAAFKIDQTAPVLTCSGVPPTFTLNQAGATVTATIADAVSGPASPTASSAADTSSTGGKTVVISGADNAGNVGTVSCAYTVASPTTVTIDTPTTEATFASTGPFLALTGTASVEGGTIETVTWTNDRGGSGTATGPAAGATHWGVPAIPLQGGVNIITVTATNTEGHSSTDSVTVTYDALTYYLAEGSTGFFDLDIALANPHTVEAPITLTFIKPDGSTVVQSRTLPPTSRTTVRVDDIDGLDVTPVSTMVTSTSQLPLGVERTMAWDGGAYGGSGGEAVNQPRSTWHFAEGAQGFFQSYFMVLNPSASETMATVTFQTEAGASVVRTYPMAPHSRLVVDASTVAELAASAFGTTIEATVPIVAERAMYFGSTPQRLFAGGHASVGAPDLFTTWYFAEGATGSFFDTYLLIGNPGGAEAHVTLRYLLDNGTVVTRTKTIAPHARLTVEAESDAPELAQAAFSTQVTSDVPVVAERAMYWIGAPGPWTEAHDSLGIPTPGTKWVLAEGRVGGPLGYQTFILLGNPSDTEAEVTITYLRGDGTTTTGTYTVAPASRANVSVNAQVPALQNEAFAARIEVTNGVGIVVERSMYWNADGVIWAGGTSVVATRLP